MAHDILNDAEDRTDHDQDADGVQHEHHPLPTATLIRCLLYAVVPPESDVEYRRRNCEDAEDNDLDEQAPQDNIFARLHRVSGGQNSRATRLYQERDDIARDKDLGEPLDRNDGQRLAADTANHPPQDHIDGSGEKRRRDENEGTLDDIGNKFVGLVFGGGPRSVAHDLHWMANVSVGTISDMES